MNSDADAERYNRLQWQATLRWLVATGGFLIFAAAVVALLHTIGADTTGLITILLSSAGGAGVGFAARPALDRLRGGPPAE
jgi:hypothetical protein